MDAANPSWLGSLLRALLPVGTWARTAHGEPLSDSLGATQIQAPARRGSRPVLGGPGGAIPPGYSTICAPTIRWATRARRSALPLIAVAHPCRDPIPRFATPRRHVSRAVLLSRKTWTTRIRTAFCYSAKARHPASLTSRHPPRSYQSVSTHRSHDRPSTS